MLNISPRAESLKKEYQVSAKGGAKKRREGAKIIDRAFVSSILRGVRTCILSNSPCTESEEGRYHVKAKGGDGKKKRKKGIHELLSEGSVSVETELLTLTES